MNPDGSGNHVFAAAACEGSTETPAFMAWSPDGAWLAYLCLSQSDSGHTLVIRGSGGAVVDRVDGVSYFKEAAAWQPEAEAAGEPQLRLWWAGMVGWLRPVTVGKAAQIGASVAVLAGLGVLAWGVLRGSREAVGPFPSGEVIAYSVEQGERNEKIYLLGVQTAERFNFSLATVMAGRFSPQAWSPDGTWLAFTFTKSRNTFVGSSGLYVAHPDGSDVRPLAEVGFGDNLPQCWAGDWLSWSPDSAALAYADMSGVVRTVALDGGGVEIGPGYAPTWSRDGGLLAYHRNAKWLPEFGNGPVDNDRLCEVVVTNPSATSQEQVIARDVAPIWSLDGGSVIYRRAGRVFQKPIGGGDEEVFLERNPLNLVWSPDGRSVAGADYSGVFLASPVQGGILDVRGASFVTWSPDSTQIA